MALRSLAAKTRVPAAAVRLASAHRVSPASGCRALPFSSSSKSARDWYLLQREHYDSVTRELKSFSREVVWTERLAKLLNVVYVLSMPFIVGPFGLFDEIFAARIVRKVRRNLEVKVCLSDDFNQ